MSTIWMSAKIHAFRLAASINLPGWGVGCGLWKVYKNIKSSIVGSK